VYEYGLEPQIIKSQYVIEIRNLEEEEYYFKIVAFNDYGNLTSNGIYVPVEFEKGEDNNSEPPPSSNFFPIETIITAAVFALLLLLLIGLYIHKSR
jgi:hypothetical protein